LTKKFQIRKLQKKEPEEAVWQKEQLERLKLVVNMNKELLEQISSNRIRKTQNQISYISYFCSIVDRESNKRKILLF
jgi:hypothetical protein